MRGERGEKLAKKGRLEQIQTGKEKRKMKRKKIRKMRGKGGKKLMTAKMKIGKTR